MTKIQHVIENKNFNPIFPSRQKFQGIVLGCSGGVDSVVLLHWLVQSNSLGLPIYVVHVNHMLRGKESQMDEELVRKLAQNYGLAFLAFQLILPEDHTKKSLQNWARNERLKLWHALKNKGWAICLAHHQDDLAENFIFRLGRGASPFHWGGIKEWAKGFIWRPFLSVKKSELYEIAKIHGLEFRHDSSNDLDFYSRNKIRNQLLPLFQNQFKDISDKIAHGLEKLSETEKFIQKTLWEQLNIKGFNELSAFLTDGVLTFNKTKICGLDPVLQDEWLVVCLQFLECTYSGQDSHAYPQLSKAHFQSLRQAINAYSFHGELHLPFATKLLFSKNFLKLMKISETELQYLKGKDFTLQHCAS